MPRARKSVTPDSKSFKKRLGKKKGQRWGDCPEDYHPSKGYTKIKPYNKFCVKDCDEWDPPHSSGRKGTCVKRKTNPWLEGLKKYYQDHKKPGFTLKQAIEKYKPIYDKAHPKKK